MERESLSLLLMLPATSGFLIGLAIAWQFRTGLRRGLGIAGLLAAYLLVSYLSVSWATVGTFDSGLSTALLVMLLVAVMTLTAVVCLFVAAFTGWGNHRKRFHTAWLWIGLLLMLPAAAGRYLEQPVATGWHLHGLDSSDPDTRLEAITALTQSGRSDIAETLRPLLADSVSEVRARVIWALIALNDTVSLPDIRPMMSDSAPEVRAAAIYARSGLGDLLTITELLPCLDDADAEVREAALDALDAIDPGWRSIPEVPAAHREPDRYDGSSD